MECESTLFVKNHIPYLWDLSNSFSNSFIDFYSCESFHQVIYREEWSIKLCIDNGGWHETLNLLHVSRCETVHFVTSYMKQNKSRKQTLGSAQYGLEISFKSKLFTAVTCRSFSWNRTFAVAWNFLTTSKIQASNCLSCWLPTACAVWLTSSCQILNFQGGNENSSVMEASSP